MITTPAPLSWLAFNQAHLFGRIERLRQKRAKLEGQLSGHQEALVSTVRRLTLVEAQIRSLAKLAADNNDVAKMYPVPYELDEVVPKRPHYNPYLLPRGSMSMLIHRTMWVNGGRATTDDLVEQVMKATESAPDNHSYVKKRVLIRLWRLVGAGKLKSDGSTPRTRNRTWYLSK